MTKPQDTQVTPKGEEIPIPKRGDFLGNLMARAAYTVKGYLPEMFITSGGKAYILRGRVGDTIRVKLPPRYHISS